MTKQLKQAEQKHIEQMTGEELAEIITQQYELFMQTRNNIMTIQNELAKRKITQYT